MSASSSKHLSRTRPTITSHSQRLPFDRLPEDVGDALIGPGREARDSKPGTTYNATKRQSVDLGSRIMRSGGGVYFGTTHFAGGGHAFGENSTVINNFSDDNDELKKILSIGKLPFAQADYQDYKAKKKSGACFPGTRAALLQEMEDWVNKPAESNRMYVLSGLAGIGKSTVAYTIAERAAELGLLGASFFFSRDEVERKNATKLFTTIAYQLCVYDETFAKAIRDVVLTERGYAATAKSPLEQLQVLIVEPLRCTIEPRTPSRPILVVIDALDECDEDDEGAVVMALSQLVQLLPVFKVILTTRPQHLVNSLFFNHDGHTIFYLQDIEEKVVDSDIRLYLKHSLSLEQVQRLYPKRRWCASDKEIDFLVLAAGRLFIIASTAVRYILDKVVSNPAAQMKRLLGKAAQSFRDLNQFYTIILRDAVPANCDDDIVNRYQSVIGAILSVQHPLPVTMLAQLIDTEEEDIRGVLDNLQSVILLGSDDIPRVYHKSFPDYIIDLTRCQDDKLCVEPGIHHTRLATRCFEIMDQHLKYNILGFGDPARFMNNKDGLEEDGITDEQLQEKIPQRLGYACVYWANHLEVATMENADLMKLFENFAYEHILHWLEVLSLIRKLGSAHLAVRAVMRLVQSTSSELHQLLSDALRFISKFYEVIERSALHVYYSALPFAPTGSLLYRRYIKKAIHNVWGVDGGPEKWDALVASLNHGEWVRFIKFSLDSTMFASVSEAYTHGELKIWDAATGRPISGFTIPSYRFRFGLANDFSIIVSSNLKDNAMTFYNMNGTTRSTLFTTSNIEKLALSSESSRVAAALSNGTICLWDSRNTELINTFDGFNPDAPMLEFSPTGTRLAYPASQGKYIARIQSRCTLQSANRIVKLRDAISGRFIADLECESRCFVFSADGSRIASLSNAYPFKLALWSSDNGQLIGDVTNVHDNKLAISANGSQLASANLNQVTLWSENGGQLSRVKVLDAYSRSIVFSRDNILAIATENAVKLYDVKLHSSESFISTLPFGSATALAFSPNCTSLAAGSKYGTIFLWYIQQIEPLSSSQNRVTAFAFSRDYSQLTCGFENGCVELWETMPTMRRMQQTPVFDPFHQGHTKRITALAFSPDGRLFACGSDKSGSIKLWNGRNGALYGTLKAGREIRSVAVSNSVLAAGWDGGVTLWTLDALRLIHSFQLENVQTVSIAENSALVAVSSYMLIRLLDVVNQTTIAKFNGPGWIHTVTFLPDNSHLVAQPKYGAFLSINLNNKYTIEGPTFEHLIQLPNIPLWHGVPIWYDRNQCSLVAWFSQRTTPVPVLWIPHGLWVTEWTRGPSMIALFCNDGRVIFLRLLNIHAGCFTTPLFISLLNRTR